MKEHDWPADVWNQQQHRLRAEADGNAQRFLNTLCRKKQDIFIHRSLRDQHKGNVTENIQGIEKNTIYIQLANSKLKLADSKSDTLYQKGENTSRRQGPDTKSWLQCANAQVMEYLNNSFLFVKQRLKCYLVERHEVSKRKYAYNPKQRNLSMETSL